jgi:hypothetical protein
MILSISLVSLGFNPLNKKTPPVPQNEGRKRNISISVGS